MKIKYIFVLLLTLTLLSACSSTYDVEGEVFKKEYVPDNTYMITMIVNNSPVVIPQTDPEKWLVTIGNNEYQVAENIFKKIEIGDYVKGTINGTDDSHLIITKE